MSCVGTTGLYFSPGSRIDSTALQLLLSDDASEQYLGTSLSASEFWNGFLPYFLVHVPETFTLVRYYVMGDAPAYGISGGGFALVAPGSACFVSMAGRGSARNFGGSDAFMEVEAALEAWERTGRATQTDLRLRLIPKQNDSFSVRGGKVYTRRDHFLHAWMDQDGSSSTKFQDR